MYLCSVRLAAGTGNRQLCVRGIAAHHAHSSSYIGKQVSLFIHQLVFFFNMFLNYHFTLDTNILQII